MNAGPRNGHSARRPRVLPSMAARAAVSVPDARRASGAAGTASRPSIGRAPRPRLLTARATPDAAVAAGDGVAVRIVGRVAQQPADVLLELIRELVLEPLGLAVKLVERHPHRAVEERLPQTVVAEHLERGGQTARG